MNCALAIVISSMIAETDTSGTTYTFVMHIRHWKYTSDKTILIFLLQTFFVHTISMFSCMQVSTP